MAGDVPNEISSVCEGRNLASIEDCIGIGINDLDCFDAPAQVGIPIESVDGNLMSFSIGEVDVQTES